jgi:hypothetical protein
MADNREPVVEDSQVGQKHFRSEQCALVCVQCVHRPRTLLAH